MKYIYDDGGREKYFKGHAGDCVVRALAILLNEDYKAVYNFAFNRLGKSPRNGVNDTGAVYFKKGLIYEEFSGFADDYDIEGLDCNFIIQYDRHVHAVINNTIHDTHQKYELYQAKGIWVEKKNHKKLLKIVYPHDYDEVKTEKDEHGLTWVR